MKFYNIKIKSEILTFYQAVKIGLGKSQGLFFPEYLKKIEMEKINKILSKDFIQLSAEILDYFIGDEIKKTKLINILKKTFSFPISIKKITDNISVLELFHGPTLAFKDFGSKFMAQILFDMNEKQNEKFLILTATSGDTGAAVAHAFYEMKNIFVVILYPFGKISKLQEKIFCTLGKNIITIAIDGDFDTCQQMVKQAFEDIDIKNLVNINSANSINISRLLAQVCYYFGALSKLPKKYYNNLVISVPSGNFGNLTAGLFARSLGLPIKRFIAATNKNDTVPRFLSTGKWLPKKTITTISNAMDISKPNNWIRIKELFYRKSWNFNKLLNAIAINESLTKKAMIELSNKYNYIADPHSAIAYQALKNNINENEYGLFLSTAHPAKFQEIVESVLCKKIQIPDKVSKFNNLKILSHKMKPDYLILKKFLINLFK